jgi:hypothetical protein
MISRHTLLTAGRWHELSLMDQLGNIGGEISRAAQWQAKDEPIFQGAVERALELFDLTLNDTRWQGRHREVGRAREVFVDAVSGGREYGSSLEDLTRYFNQFAYAARLRVQNGIENREL